MSSLLLSALAKLDESVRVLEECLDPLGAGLEVSKDQFVRNLIEARQNADAVREMVRAKNPDVDWTDRQSLENLIWDLEAAQAGCKELRLGRLLELAEELNAGTITHRLKSRVTALEGLRESAVRELLAEAAEDAPKDLPGPQAFAWMQWAFGLHGDADAAQFSELERDFPAVVRFVGEMEESYWQPRESTHEIPEQVAIDETSSVPRATIQRQALQLSESAPAFAARYGHLSAAKVSQLESAALVETVAAAVAQVPESHAVESLPWANADPKLEAAELPAHTNAHNHPVNGSGSLKHSPQTSAEGSADTVKPLPAEAKEVVSQPYSAADVAPVEGERRGSRFGLSRSVVITVGVTAAIVLVMVVISAFSGNLTGKRGSSPPRTVASSPAKEGSADTPTGSLSDIELVGQIEQRLKAVKGSSIYVTVQHGTAILQGQVPSEDALAMAEQLTLQSSQIKIVRNRLQIEDAKALHSTSRPTKANTVKAE